MKRLLVPALAGLICISGQAEAAPRFFGTTSIQAGDAVANTNTATVLTTKLIMGPTDVTGDPRSTDVRYGQTFGVDAVCTIGTLATPGTLTLDVVNATGVSGTTYTVLGTTGAFTPPASLTANTNELRIRGHVVFNATGSAAGVATFFGDAQIVGASNATTTYPMLPSTMATQGTSGWATGITTSANPINAPAAIRVTWATASASNTITCSVFEWREA